MRIIISQEEIEEAIEKLILDQVDVPEDMRIDIALKATRGDEGYTAEIDIVAPDAPTDGSDRSIDPRIDAAKGAEDLGIAQKVLEAKREATLPRRRGRPAGARNRPKGENVAKDTAAEKPAGDLAVTEEVKAAAEKLANDPVVAPVAEEPQEAQQSTADGDVVVDTAEVEKAPEMAAEAIPEVIETNEATVQPESAPTPEPTPDTPVEAPVEVAAETVAEAPVTEADENQQEGEVLAQDRVTGDDQEETVEAQLTTAPVSTTDAGDPAPDPAAIAPTRSLFANLGKPVNTDTSES